MRFEMRFVRGHVEVYDKDGRFVFSADNEREAEEDLAMLIAGVGAAGGRGLGAAAPAAEPP